jgi:hypothetical protein
MSPIFEEAPINGLNLMQHIGFEVGSAYPECVVVGACDYGDRVDLHVAKGLDDLGNAFFAWRQLRRAV